MKYFQRCLLFLCTLHLACILQLVFEERKAFPHLLCSAQLTAASQVNVISLQTNSAGSSYFDLKQTLLKKRIVSPTENTQHVLEQNWGAATIFCQQTVGFCWNVLSPWQTQRAASLPCSLCCVVTPGTDGGLRWPCSGSKQLFSSYSLPPHQSHSYFVLVASPFKKQAMQKNIILFLLEIMRKKTKIITVQDTMPLLSLLTIATCEEAAFAARPQKTIIHSQNHCNSPEAAKSH